MKASSSATVHNVNRNRHEKSLLTTIKIQKLLSTESCHWLADLSQHHEFTRQPGQGIRGCQASCPEHDADHPEGDAMHRRKAVLTPTPAHQKQQMRKKATISKPSSGDPQDNRKAGAASTPRAPHRREPRSSADKKDEERRGCNFSSKCWTRSADSWMYARKSSERR